MRKGGGKAKGSQFERDICKRLSSWLTCGKREDVLWRSAMSGGRSTVGQRAGKFLTAQAGDISSISSEGFPLTNRFFIELKFYADLDFEAVIAGSGKLLRFWQQCCKEAEFYKKAPLLIAKENRQPVMLCTNALGAHLLNSSPLIKVEFPIYDLKMAILGDILSRSVSQTRLLHYDYGAAIASYRLHKSGAAQRGIEFEFEFDEWVSWWESNLGPEWQSRRGRRKGQYVMSRNDDVGPYAVWNVKCCTQEENASERAANGTAARGQMIATNKLSENDVVSIFYDKRDPLSIANQYGIHRSNVYLIKARKTWKHTLTARRPRKRIE